VLVVDASCLCEVLIGTPGAEAVRDRLAAEEDQAAPHVVDVEVLGEAWPGERFGHRLLLARAWELRDTVRGPDAMYVALAEALDAVLLTTDRRLAAATGPRCEIEAIAAG